MNNNDLSTSDSVYHSGELAVQTRAGVAEQTSQLGKMMVKDYMTEQHRMFFSSLPMIFIGAADKQGDVWASVLFGDIGFMSTPDASHLAIDQQVSPLEPLSNQLSVGDNIGVLGLEFETRRRNRASMTLSKNNEQKMLLKVKQSFGNCPKFIQRRERIAVKHVEVPESIEFAEMSEELKSFISRADNFIIASQYLNSNIENKNGVDVSHRGGMPGFIRFNNEDEMLIPDYAGNNFYNTLGNISKNPKVGLLFIDFEKCNLVMLTGEAEIVWAEDEVLPFSKVDRMTKFRLHRGVKLKKTVPFRWSLEDYSPFSKTYEEI